MRPCRRSCKTLSGQLGGYGGTRQGNVVGERDPIKAARDTGFPKYKDFQDDASPTSHHPHPQHQSSSPAFQHTTNKNTLSSSKPPNQQPSRCSSLLSPSWLSLLPVPSPPPPSSLLPTSTPMSLTPAVPSRAAPTATRFSLPALEAGSRARPTAAARARRRLAICGPALAARQMW